MLVRIELAARRWRSGRRLADDTGAALAPVLIVFTVGFIVAIMMASVSLFAITTIGKGRSTVASIAAAEAGRDTVVAQLSQANPVCPSPIVTSTTAPAFTTQIFASSSAIAPATSTDSGVTAGCPTQSSTYVVLRSTGTAPDGGTTTIDSVYKWQVGNAVTMGAGSYGYMNNGFTAALGTYNGDMVLRNGDFNCSTATTINGDVYVLNGNFTCGFLVTVNGNIYVSNGDVTVNSASTVTGGIYASRNVTVAGGVKVGTSTAPTGIIAGGTVSLGSTLVATTVYGNITAGGGVALTTNLIGKTTVVGDIVAGGGVALTNGTGLLTLLGGDVKGSVSSASTAGITIDQLWKVTGAATTGGRVTTNCDLLSLFCGSAASRVEGTTLTPPTITSPVPSNLMDRTAWMDLNARTTWTGYTSKLTFTGGDCTRNPLWIIPGVFPSNATNQIVAALQTDGPPLLIDTTGCTSPIDFTITGINAKRNAVMLVKNASILLGSINAASTPAPTETNPRMLFVVQPDDTVNQQPDCAGRNKITYGLSSDGATLFSNNPMRVMIYSPCGIAFSGSLSTLKGQMYAQRSDADAAILQNYQCREMWVEQVFDLTCDVDDVGRWGGGSATAVKKLGQYVSQTEGRS